MQRNNIYVADIILKRAERQFKAFISKTIWQSDHYKEMQRALHSEEQKYFKTVKFKKRIKSFLLGRYAAKLAISSLTGEKSLSEIYVQSGIFTQPIVIAKTGNIQVSISHCNNIGLAIAFPEAHPMGIDIEEIAYKNIDTFKYQTTTAEIKMLASIPINLVTGLTLLWAAKEALSKVMKTGLTTSFRIFELADIKITKQGFICTYKNFAQYKTLGLIGGNYMVAITHPLKTEIKLDIHTFKQSFACTKTFVNSITH